MTQASVHNVANDQFQINDEIENIGNQPQRLGNVNKEQQKIRSLRPAVANRNT